MGRVLFKNKEYQVFNFESEIKFNIAGKESNFKFNKLAIFLNKDARKFFTKYK